jgi:hypothetical protein
MVNGCTCRDGLSIRCGAEGGVPIVLFCVHSKDTDAVGIRMDILQTSCDRIDAGVRVGRVKAGSLRDIVDTLPLLGILIPHRLSSSVLLSPTVLSLSALPLPISPNGLCCTICSSLSFIVVSMPVISCTVLFFPCLSTWLRRKLSGSALLEFSCEGLAEETACLARLMKGFRMGKFTAMMPTNYGGVRKSRD